MPDKIFVNEDLDIIEVESFGEVTADEIARSIAKVREIYSEKGVSKILVDTCKQESLPTTIDIFDLFSTFPREFKLAILVKQSQITEEDLDFIETIAVNRAIRMKIFSERDVALEWLDI
jgi:hypothetical protein